MIKCEICGKEFKQITSTHLKNKHGISVEEYKRMFPESKIMSDETIEFLSAKCKEQNDNDNFGFKDGHKVNEGKAPWNLGLTKETDERVLAFSVAQKGKKLSLEQRIKLSSAKKKFYKEHPEAILSGEKNGMYGKKLSDAHLKALLMSRNNSKINKVERKLLGVVCQYGFRYTGDRTFMLTFKDGTHKFPDFINQSAKIAVEVFGDYWHKGENPEELVNKYKGIGWDCLVLWEHEVNDNYSPEDFERWLGIYEEPFNLYSLEDF